MWWMFRHLRFVIFASAMEFVTANDQCRTEVNIQGMALKRSVFKRWSVAAPHLCDVKCGKEITCQSYNYNRKYQICELNNRTKEARPENFLSAPAWFYIRRLNGRAPLGSIPELPALSCHEIKASEGKHIISGKYWLDPTCKGKAKLIHCDMVHEDMDECKYNISNCDVNANCTNTYGSYKCICKEGYTGDGHSCSDIDECKGNHSCHVNATCTNIKGLYICTCHPGYTGNGRDCTDINECKGNHSCHVNATCMNTLGSHVCQCHAGYTGNGQNCTAPLSFTPDGRKGRLGIIQKFTVPRSAKYLIKALGARGGTHSYDYGTYYGGHGAAIKGTFRLTKGTILSIVVGQRGGDSVEVKGGQRTTMTAAQLGLSIADNAGTGGGGGSFVYTATNVLLLAAGGGGGASGGYNGVDGQAGTNGTSSVGNDPSQVKKGGTTGQSGECNNDNANYHGGVGAGWNGQSCSRKGSEHGEGGGSRAQGWIGGQAGGMNSGNNGGPAPGAVGGFGGGGGGAEDNGASGGGGGYSGGGSGTHGKQAGGGGGSYCAGENCHGVTGGNVNEDGLVQIIVIFD